MSVDTDRAKYFFFFFAFIVFNPCFTIQVYHGVFTEFYNEFLE